MAKLVGENTKPMAKLVGENTKPMANWLVKTPSNGNSKI